MRTTALLIILVALAAPARAQIRADEVNGTDAFNQINNTIAVLYGNMVSGMPNQGIVDATNIKGSRAAGIATMMVINQSQIQVSLGGAEYQPLAGSSPYTGTMVSIGVGGMTPIAVTNVDLMGQGDKATTIQCSTGNVPCIQVIAGSHIHIHDMTIIGGAIPASTALDNQDCILIALPSASTFPRIDSVEIDHVHFVNCGHSNIEAWGVTNLRIHDNTFDDSGYAGLAFPIVAPCLASTTNSYFNPINTFGTAGKLFQIETAANLLPVGGDYVYISGTNTGTISGLFKILDFIDQSTAHGGINYELVTTETAPSSMLGSTQLFTCDNGVWIEQRHE
jgi:hypothetical protein